jgi:hypothetical protein
MKDGYPFWTLYAPDALAAERNVRRRVPLLRPPRSGRNAVAAFPLNIRPTHGPAYRSYRKFRTEIWPAERADAFPADTVAFGDPWLASHRSALLSVPSVIVPESRSLLLNVAHPDAARAGIASIRPFGFDERLWRSTGA